MQGSSSVERPKDIPTVRYIRWVLISATLLAGALVAFLIVSGAQARRSLSQDPEVALAWRSNDGQALSAVAERQFLNAKAAGRPAVEAGALARRSLEAGPLDVRALRVLGWVAEDSGDSDRALRLIKLAAARSQRDVSSHLWMFYNRVSARDYDAAFGHADALMRYGGLRQDTATVVSTLAASDSRAAAALARRMAYGPGWREVVLSDLALNRDPAKALSVMLAIKEAGSDITPKESAILASRLVQEKRVQEAYLSWILLQPASSLGAARNVFDGEFEGLPGAGPFAWNFSGARDGDVVEIASGPSGSGQVLSARTRGGVKSVLAEQMLLLAPGVYRLATRSYNDSAADPGMKWVVSCHDSAAELLSLAPGPGATAVWTDSKATFVVSQDCPTQKLVLTSTGDPGGPSWVRFESVSIDRIDGAEG